MDLIQRQTTTKAELISAAIISQRTCKQDAITAKGRNFSLSFGVHTCYGANPPARTFETDY
jgi:hypothetical protein